MQRVLVNSANWKLGGRFELDRLGDCDDEREGAGAGTREGAKEGEELFEESETESGYESEEEEEEKLADGRREGSGKSGESYDPLRASQVSRRTEGLLSAANGLMSAGRDALTESRKKQLGFHLGDLREIRSNLVVLIHNYQDQEETLLHLVTLLGNVEAALQHLALDSEQSSSTSPPPASSQPTSSSSEMGLLENVIHMQRSMRVSQMYPIKQDDATSGDETGDDEEAAMDNAATSNAVAGCSTDVSCGDCGMCWEGMTERNSRELECHHRFCDECLAHYLRVELEEARVVDIDCPHQECTELFCEEDVEALLTEDEFRRLQQLIFLTEVRQDPNARWCPQPGCETVCRIDPSLPAVQLLQCETCHSVFCAFCTFSHDSRVSCRKAAKQASRREKKSLSKQDANQRKKSVKAIKNSGYKRCPGCNLVVSKISGCNHMTCRCGREWYWICGETIITTTLHYTFSQCKGLQFSDVDGLTTTAKLFQYARLAAVPVVVVGGAALALAMAPIGAAVFGVYHLRQRRRDQQLSRRRRRRVTNTRRQPPHVDFGFRVGVHGGRAVGKTAITIQFISSFFIQELDQPFDDTYRKQVVLGDATQLLDILDTAGDGKEDPPHRDELYRLYPHYLIVYAINSRASFDEVDSIIENILRVREIELLPSTIILGNKSDLEEERQVSHEEGQQKASKYRARFMETSAKDRINIDEAFHQLIRSTASLDGFHAGISH